MAGEINNRWLVVAGSLLCIGIVVAMWLFGARAAGGGAVARVNGVAVQLTESTLRTSGSARRDATMRAHAPSLGDVPRAHTAAVAIAIADELWLQEALRLDLAHRDPRVRNALLASVKDVALSAHPLMAPGDAKLRAHFAAHKYRFARATGVHLQRILFSENGDSVKVAWQKAVDAFRRINAGDDFLEVRQALGDSDPLQLPDAVIASESLPALLGVDMTVSVLRLAPGQVSRPVEEKGFIYIYRMLARDVKITPTYADARPEVLVDYQRTAREAALAGYLAQVRGRAHVVMY